MNQLEFLLYIGNRTPIQKLIDKTTCACASNYPMSTRMKKLAEALEQEEKAARRLKDHQRFWDLTQKAG